MADRRGIGNVIAPPRFLAFLLILLVGTPAAATALHGWAVGAMAGFDTAALVFLFSCLPLLGTREARVIREHAEANDANRTFLLAVTGIVMAVLLIAIAAGNVGPNPQPFTRALIIATLAAALLFSNKVFSLPYTRPAYI